MLKKSGKLFFIIIILILVFFLEYTIGIFWGNHYEITRKDYTEEDLKVFIETKYNFKDTIYFIKKDEKYYYLNYHPFFLSNYKYIPTKKIRIKKEYIGLNLENELKKYDKILSIDCNKLIIFKSKFKKEYLNEILNVNDEKINLEEIKNSCIIKN